MRDVHHHTHPVHFFNHLFAESIHSQVPFVVSGRAAKLVVAVVAEGHIHHAPVAETLHVAEVVPDGITVFYTQHDGFLAFSLQAGKVGWSVSDVYIRRTLGYHCFDFAQDAVGFGGSGKKSLVCQFQLLQVGYHDGGIQMSFRHLVKVHQYLRVTAGEVYLLVEEHRCVAMRVKAEDAVVQLLGFAERSRFTDQPTEQWHHAFVASEYEAFGMPLYAQHRLVFGRFHGFDDSIGSAGADPESGCRFFHGLMVERVDGQRICTEQFMQQGILFDADSVRSIAAFQVLVVLDACTFHLYMDVLIKCPAESRIHGLDASADAQDGNLSVGCQLGEQ